MRTRDDAVKVRNDLKLTMQQQKIDFERNAERQQLELVERKMEEQQKQLKERAATERQQMEQTINNRIAASIQAHQATLLPAPPPIDLAVYFANQQSQMQILTDMIRGMNHVNRQEASTRPTSANKQNNGMYYTVPYPLA